MQVAGGTATALTPADTLGHLFNITVEPDGNGPVTVSLPTGVAKDVTRNDSPAVSATYSTDTTAPTVTIDWVPDRVSGQFPARIYFSEDVTDFDITDIKVENGTVSDFIAGTSATFYDVHVNPTAEGKVTVSVPAGAAADAAGNGNIAGQVTTFYDTTAPTLQFGKVEKLPTKEVYRLPVTFSEPMSDPLMPFIKSTNGTADLISFDGTAKGVIEFVPSEPASVTITVPRGFFRDKAGNEFVKDEEFTFDPDQTAPTVALGALARQSDGTWTSAITLSEPAGAGTAFEAADLTATNATVTLAAGKSATEFVATLTPIKDGRIALSAMANAFTDAAGNQSSAGAEVEAVHDGTGADGRCYDDGR